MNFKNLLPEDTRLADLVSAISMIIVGVETYIHSPGPMMLYHPIAFWVVIFVMFGILQLSAVLYHPKVELVRVAVAWIAGLCWLYASTVNISFYSGFVGPMVGLSISNFVSFIINIAVLKTLWKR